MQVKNRFSQEPLVYNQFLDIMKDFKSQAIDTEGVIKRVISLFKGNRNLILGFNQFLPPGYKIELDAEPKPKPTIEFNHAVQYVAKIKNRFIEQPQIYSEFLDILHDYQAKKTIDEVYQRVQKLFGDHEDLLLEFKHFLPDNNSNTNAAPKRGPKAKTKKAQKPPYGEPKGKTRRTKDRSADAPPPITQVPVPKKAIPASSGYQRADKDKALAQQQAQQAQQQPGTGKRAVYYPAGSQKELALLEKIKQTVTRSQWTQLLKCLNLFSIEIVSRTELVSMVDDILAGTDLAEKFRNAIGYDDWEERQLSLQQRQNYYAFVSSVDFSTCKEVTPSYRQLPEEIAVPPCSGRTTLSDNVLNDKCISIPTGSEDFSFKSTRKNIYEENLFKCEDERSTSRLVLSSFCFRLFSLCVCVFIVVLVRCRLTYLLFF